MKSLRHLLVLLIFSCCFAQFTMGQQTLRVRIDAKEFDRALLIQKLNEHGADHHIKFELVNQNFDYRIAYGTGQAGGIAPYGPVVATASVTRVFDAKGSKALNFLNSVATGAKQMQALRMPRRRRLSKGCRSCAPPGSAGSSAGYDFQ